MKTAGDLLKNRSVEDLVKAARESSSLISKEQAKFTKDIGGIIVPNAFQVPNEIIDDGWLAQLNGSEVKVLIYLIRKTFGFNKIRGDIIPLSQITDGTGLSRQSAMTAVQTLERCNLIRVIRGKAEDGTRKINYYQLITRGDYNKPPQR